MINPDIERFHAYVEQTSRPDVWEKRKGFTVHLCERNHPSINQLVNCMPGGNARDRAWLSQALKAGVIRIGDGGYLRLSQGQNPLLEAWVTFHKAWRAFGDAGGCLPAISETIAHLVEQGLDRDQLFAHDPDPN